jgi:hypothetical protein
MKHRMDAPLGREFESYRHRGNDLGYPEGSMSVRCEFSCSIG